MTTTNFVLCICPKKAEHFCKNWDGKGNIPARIETMRVDCKNNPDECEFLVEPKKREGCDWIWQTISGSPADTAEIVQERHKVIAKTKPKKIQRRTCADCEEEATHKIEGYKPTYLCMKHGEAAIADGFKVVELTEEELNA